MFGLGKKKKEEVNTVTGKVVVKRDGSEEQLDANKLKVICKSLGLGDLQQKQLTENIINTINSLSQDRIKSDEIREMMRKELQKINQYYVDQFDWYYKTNTLQSDGNNTPSA